MPDSSHAVRVVTGLDDAHTFAAGTTVLALVPLSLLLSCDTCVWLMLVMAICLCPLPDDYLLRSDLHFCFRYSFHVAPFPPRRVVAVSISYLRVYLS